MEINELTNDKNQMIAIYGLSTETERFLKEWGGRISVLGLLDGFCEDGKLYGYPIISLKEAIKCGVKLIIVVARPGSCKAIAKRIGNVCRENEILLFDIRGRNLLENSKGSYSFDGIIGYKRKDLTDKMAQAEIISFDLFDTLVMRKVFVYTDVFEIMNTRLRNDGKEILDFTSLRLQAEKECSRGCTPRLQEIYEYVVKKALENDSKESRKLLIGAEELADLEWNIDFSLLVPRKEICEVFKKAVLEGKKVVITTDTYYSEKQIQEILKLCDITDYYDLYISCERGVSKTSKSGGDMPTESLFDLLVKENGLKPEAVLHIGDDEYADVEKAKEVGVRSFMIYSAADIFDAVGGFGAVDYLNNMADRTKVGLFLARQFSNPFVFEDDRRVIKVPDAYDIGYLFCAPIISDFTLWFSDEVIRNNVSEILFCARDGYLMEKLYRRVDRDTSSVYFLTSRTAAIRAGMEDENDIAYVDSMKYSGSKKDYMRARFGINAAEDIDVDERKKLILEKSAILRKNYKKYVDTLELKDGLLAMFDFVAKGTTQMYIRKILSQQIKGFYFMQNEPEFMKDKGLDIKPFYADSEKNTSAIFDNYYILETILTAPTPSIDEFDQDGRPVYAKETRNERDIACFMRAQKGIEDFFEDYIRIVPADAHIQNKTLDEIFLQLINHVVIEDENFISLTVEDPFFGRMTGVKDVIG